MVSTVAKFSLFTFLYFYSVSLQTKVGCGEVDVVFSECDRHHFAAIVVVRRRIARRRHRGLHKDLQITPENLSILTIKGG
ncbi:hypothetical protein [Nostoc favosum]|uniref:Secreted protein n=1 Tax=Nostoc favosum CHAB5714 TaxID=2780399 RepID=A0ABS8I3X1_9NOSO|nr:hypothetical protein [Nostoc favosum]MCC5598671.1 hypothetical protein [Nostoc favosum CHAB5714]